MVASNKVKYSLDPTGEFNIEGYNSAKLFSSFFPGIAGKQGIPMWLFYVNRGQCVCSMGVYDKEHPIMEFLPANRAYQLTSTQGFRTFLKLENETSTTYYEPFQDNLIDRKIDRTQKLKISSASLILEELNRTLGLKFTVEYFNVPQETYSGLVRILRIENQSNRTVKLEGLDGLPLIIPYGINNVGLKFMRRLFEAFVEVSNYQMEVPFFRGKVKPTDTPDVQRIIKGNFYTGFQEVAGKSELIKPIVDPFRIFGSRTDLSYPENFLTKPLEKLYEGQILENRLPCSMGAFKTSLKAGESYSYYSIIGHAASRKELNALIPRITKLSYLNSKQTENRELIATLTQKNFICSSQTELDKYARQNFLDNTLRGGFPHTIKGNDSQFTIHLYSRKHGDLERDYNDYKLTPTHYSQGNGNYRDVNQNRRNDLLFNPDVKGDNVEQFYNLIQLDGFNPLVIKETRFKVIDKQKLGSFLKQHLPDNKVETLRESLRTPFTPGELTTLLNDNKITLQQDTELFLADLISLCEKVHDTEHAEGYWTDHWTYNLDLLENYLAVYPEAREDILFNKRSFTFYDNPHLVQSRADKYVLWEGNPMQLGSVKFNEAKAEMISRRLADNNLVHTKMGKGEVYKTNLITKLLCLIVNKMASLDPAGIGVEMETDKPNWYDALNGLPGQIGSSLNETLEIRRHILFLLDSSELLGLKNKKWQVFEELKSFLDKLHSLLQEDLEPYRFWDKATTAKEHYRDLTARGINGEFQEIEIAELKKFFQTCLRKLDEGIAKAWDGSSNVISTYFISEVDEYEKLTEPDTAGNLTVKKNARGLTCFRAKKFKHRALPLFLEGPVHYLRCHRDLDKARELAANIRESGLYDKKIKMYKVNESLAAEPPEIGRARTFSPGWFENESVWLHMEYKYMLELLRSGLHEEFYRDFKDVFVPFFQPEVYGRSILENSSFIVSSANPDPSIHGNGFVARLSGATAEFIHILSLMTIGKKPFTVNKNGELQLQFKPVLPDWLFTNEITAKKLFIDGEWQDVEFPADTFSFMFLSNTLVTFHNPERKNTYGADKVSPAGFELTYLDGKVSSLAEPFIAGKTAEDVRAGKIKRINIKLESR